MDFGVYACENSSPRRLATMHAWGESTSSYLLCYLSVLLYINMHTHSLGFGWAGQFFHVCQQLLWVTQMYHSWFVTFYRCMLFQITWMWTFAQCTKLLNYLNNFEHDCRLIFTIIFWLSNFGFIFCCTFCSIHGIFLVSLIIHFLLEMTL